MLRSSENNLKGYSRPTAALKNQMFNKVPNTVALDQLIEDYQNEELVNQLVDWGCTVMGTLKRCKFAPFSYGEGTKTYPHQQFIEKSGPQFDHFSVQNYINVKEELVQSVNASGLIRQNGSTALMCTQSPKIVGEPWKQLGSLHFNLFLGMCGTNLQSAITAMVKI